MGKKEEIIKDKLDGDKLFKNIEEEKNKEINLLVKEGFNLFEALINGDNKSLSSDTYSSFNISKLEELSHLVRILSEWGLAYFEFQGEYYHTESYSKTRLFYLSYKEYLFEVKNMDEFGSIDKITLLSEEDVKHMIEGITVKYEDLLSWVKEFKKMIDETNKEMDLLIKDGFKIFEALLYGSVDSWNSEDFIYSNVEELTHISKILNLVSRYGFRYCNECNIHTYRIQQAPNLECFIEYKGTIFAIIDNVGKCTDYTILRLSDKQAKKRISNRTIAYDNLLHWVKEVEAYEP